MEPPPPQHRKSNFNRLTTCSLAMNISIQELPVSSPSPATSTTSTLPQLLEQLPQFCRRSISAVCVRICFICVGSRIEWQGGCSRKKRISTNWFFSPKRGARSALQHCVALPAFWMHQVMDIGQEKEQERFFSIVSIVWRQLVLEEQKRETEQDGCTPIG